MSGAVDSAALAARPWHVRASEMHRSGAGTERETRFSQPPSGWCGSFAHFQDVELLARLGRHYDLRVERVEDLWLLVRRVPGLGVMRAFLGGPECSGDLEARLPALQRMGFSELVVRTCRAVPSLEYARITPHDNVSLVVDLRDGEDAILARFRKPCRKAIRAGVRRGVTVRATRDPGDLAAVYEICRVRSRGGREFPLPPFPVVREVSQGSNTQLFVAEVAGRVVGGHLFLLSRSMFQWIGGSELSARAFRVDRVLNWEAMRWGVRSGFEFYDLGDQSLSESPERVRFKRAFGPLELPAFTYRLPGGRAKRLLAASVRTLLSLRRGGGVA